MKRVCMVVFALSIIATAGVGTLVRGSEGAGAQVKEVASGGIGLNRAQWEGLHGAGEAGQTLVSYEGGAYEVGFTNDVVSFVETGWEAVGGITTQEAEAAVSELLPSDAVLVETFYAFATSAGPTAHYVERYESRSLPEQFATDVHTRTESILVIYQETSAPGRIEPNIARVSLVVGQG